MENTDTQIPPSLFFPPKSGNLAESFTVRCQRRLFYYVALSKLNLNRKIPESPRVSSPGALFSAFVLYLQPDVRRVFYERAKYEMKGIMIFNRCLSSELNGKDSNVSFFREGSLPAKIHTPEYPRRKNFNIKSRSHRAPLSFSMTHPALIVSLIITFAIT